MERMTIALNVIGDPFFISLFHVFLSFTPKMAASRFTLVSLISKSLSLKHQKHFFLNPEINVWKAGCASFHTSDTLWKHKVSSRFKVSLKRTNPLTYEQANPVYYLGVRKSWNSWNTSNLLDGLRKSETAVEDMFIRKFIFGTWHKLFLSEVIIKRRANLIVLGGVITRSILPRKVYFLIGYTEEILSYVLKCPVKMELQSTGSKEDVIVKYV